MSYTGQMYYGWEDELNDEYEDSPELQGEGLVEEQENANRRFQPSKWLRVSIMHSR